MQSSQTTRPACTKRIATIATLLLFLGTMATPPAVATPSMGILHETGGDVQVDANCSYPETQVDQITDPEAACGGAFSAAASSCFIIMVSAWGYTWDEEYCLNAGVSLAGVFYHFHSGFSSALVSTQTAASDWPQPHVSENECAGDGDVSYVPNVGGLLRTVEAQTDQIHWDLGGFQTEGNPGPSGQLPSWETDSGGGADTGICFTGVVQVTTGDEECIQTSARAEVNFAYNWHRTHRTWDTESSTFACTKQGQDDLSEMFAIDLDDLDVLGDATFDASGGSQPTRATAQDWQDLNATQQAELNGMVQDHFIQKLDDAVGQEIDDEQEAVLEAMRSHIGRLDFVTPAMEDAREDLETLAAADTV